jgi:hypothetical protein
MLRGVTPASSAAAALAPRPALPEEVAGRARPVVLAGERLLPVVPALRPLLPDGGLRRGSVVGVAGSTSLALAVVAGPSAAGSWVAAVGVGRPPVGAVAAAGLGVVLERFPLVAALPGSGRGGWAWVVAALLDAVDVVVAWPPPHLRAADQRRLVARNRERGSVLVVPSPWTEAVDVRLTVVASEWEGMGQGHGRLLARRMEVESGGRGAAARPRRASLWLPGPDGEVAAVG